jgi:hypothetical protein
MNRCSSIPLREVVSPEVLSMTKIRLDWREAQGGDLPMVCAYCGDDATEWVDRRLSTVRPGIFCIIRTRVTVRLPYCRRHRVASWNGFLRVTARSIRDDGITLGQVSEDFVVAVEDYRDNPDKYRRRAIRLAGRRRDDHDDDWEDDDSPRRRRLRADENRRVMYGTTMTVLVIVGVACIGFGLLIFNLARAANRAGTGFGPPRPGFAPPRPGFNQPVAPGLPGQRPFR